MLETLVPDAAARGRHLLSLLFTYWTVVGVLLALVTWLAAGRMRDEQVSDARFATALQSLPVVDA